MICLTFIIVNPSQKCGLFGAPRWNVSEVVLLFVTLFLSVWSAYKYYQRFIATYRTKVLGDVFIPDSEHVILDK
jgi:hypothetical protein